MIPPTLLRISHLRKRSRNTLMVASQYIKCARNISTG
jgi:hypothetical protein